MTHRVGLGLTLVVCAAAEAAEPAATSPNPATTQSTAAAPALATTPAPDPAAKPVKPVLTKPLDLRVGDVRQYMMPSE